MLAGCTSPSEDPTCADATGPGCVTDTGDDPSFSDTPPPPRGSDLRIPAARYPTFQLGECEEVGGALEVPKENVRAVVPDAFIPTSTASSAAAGLVVRMTRCDRSLDNHTLFGQVTNYMVLARVVVENEDWTEPGFIDFYVIEQATNNPAWLDRMARTSRHYANATIDEARHDLPDGSYVTQWTTATAGWSTTIDFPYVPRDEPDHVGYDKHHWYGDGPYHRMTLHERTNVTGLPAQATVRAEGDSHLSQIIQAPLAPYYLGTYSQGKNVFMQYDGAWTPT